MKRAGGEALCVIKSLSVAMWYRRFGDLTRVPPSKRREFMISNY